MGLGSLVLNLELLNFEPRTQLRALVAEAYPLVAPWKSETKLPKEFRENSRRQAIRTRHYSDKTEKAYVHLD